MDLLDLFLILFGLSAIFRGMERGLIRQGMSAVGFIGGMFIGASTEDHFVAHAHSPLSRALISVAVVLGFGIIFMSIAEGIGDIIKHQLQGFSFLNKIDKLSGALISVVTFIVVIWLGASVFSNTPFTSLQRQIRKSIVVSTITKSFPSAPTAIAKIGHLIAPNGFPQVFSGIEPSPTTTATIPNMGIFNVAVRNDMASVVKIEGSGCGGIIEGSGFVAESNLVITNAHVVAGVTHPRVLDHNGDHPATVILFDPNLDIAVLKVRNLAGQPLILQDKTYPMGTQAAFLGYPGGGSLQAGAAAVNDVFIATGRNIYGQGPTNREVYAMNADVIPGNSGGPLIDQMGDVIGVIFAKSETYDHVGYALTMPHVLQDLEQASQSGTPVSTNSCAE